MLRRLSVPVLWTIAVIPIITAIVIIVLSKGNPLYGSILVLLGLLSGHFISVIYVALKMKQLKQIGQALLEVTKRTK